MIADAIEFIREELRAYLGVSDAQVSAGTPRTLAQHGKRSGVFISVVNTYEEATLVTRPDAERPGRPPQHLTIDVLIAFEFQTYASSLTHLSKTIELFQQKPVFSSGTQGAPGAIPLPAPLEKAVFELVKMNFEELNHLWGVLGSAYLPSVLYRVRLVKSEAIAGASGSEAPL